MVGPWIRCPNCGAIEPVRRVGDVGVPESKYGWRVAVEHGRARLRGRHGEDSDRFRCQACGHGFRSGGISMWEAFGHDPREEVTF